MNLATRCASCGTVFRVVREQLRVSEGWVRCGRCDAVFDAAEVLFDIDNGTPVQLDRGPASEPADGGYAEPEPDAEDTDNEPSVSDWAPPPVASPVAAAAPATSGASAGQATGSHFVQPPESLLRTRSTEAAPWLDSGLDKRPLLAPLAPSHPATQPPSPPAAAAGSRPGSLTGATTAPPLPSFLRSAEHAAVWRRPAVRSALAAATLLLTTSLLLQTALLWRDSLAAYWPASAPALHGLCRVVGCQVLPLRRIESLAVDSSGLNRLDGSSLYRLQLVLRNRADTAVMAPALDLSLTDVQGKPVARRVLSLADLGLPQTALEPGQELPIKVLIATGERRIDGYTVDLFYP